MTTEQLKFMNEMARGFLRAADDSPDPVSRATLLGFAQAIQAAIEAELHNLPEVVV